MSDQRLYDTLDERLHRITHAVDRVQEHFQNLRAVLFAWCPDSGLAVPEETNLPQRVVSFDRVLARNVSEAVILLDDELEILYANLSAARLVGTSEDLLIGRNIDSFLLGPPGNSSRAVVTEAYQTLAPGGSLPLHGFSARTRIGEAQPVNVVLARPEPSEDPSALILANRTEEQENATHNRSVEYLVYHDQLTSLGNRELLMHSIDQLLAEVTRNPERTAALLYLDLDGFKKINDSLGHDSGDAIILESSRRIETTLRGYDRVFRIPARDVFRLGGDEFTVLLSNLKRPEEAGRIATRIIERLKEPFMVDGPESVHAVTIGASVGIVLIPQDGTDASTLLRNADTAMYSAKEYGNRYVYFQKEMNNKAMERIILEEGLRQSFRDERFVLHYQPICNAVGSPVGLEALIRWRHPERGIIRPDTFVHIAEEARLLPDIGGWVLRRAAADLKHLHSLGFTDLYVTVNVSPRQLDGGDMEEIVYSVLSNAELAAEKLILELTETAVMAEPQTAIAHLDRLLTRNPGLRIAVDDFGTGYSSLSYLSRLPVHVLKVDKEFVRQLEDTNNGKIVDTILQLGSSLGLEVVAEGVETEVQRKVLESWGCSSFQGFRFARPLEFDDLLRYLREARRPQDDACAIPRRPVPDTVHGASRTD